MEGKNLWFEKDLMFVEFDNGQILATPVSMFPILKNATEAERKKWRFIPLGIMWDEIDEAVSFEFLLSNKKEEYLVWNVDKKTAPAIKHTAKRGITRTQKTTI